MIQKYEQNNPVPKCALQSKIWYILAPQMKILTKTNVLLDFANQITEIVKVKFACSASFYIQTQLHVYQNFELR